MSIDEARAVVASLKARRDALAVMPVPLLSAQAAADAWIEASAASINANVQSFVHPEGTGMLPPFAGADASALACRVAPEAMRLLLREQIASVYAAMPSKPLSARERQREMHSVEAQLLAAEIAEERLIRAGEARGEEIDRRENADVRAVLAFEPGEAA